MVTPIITNFSNKYSNYEKNQYPISTNDLLIDNTIYTIGPKCINRLGLFLSEGLRQIGLVFISIVKYCALKLSKLISKIFSKVFGITWHDPNSLIKSKIPLSRSEFTWNLNLALLKSAHNKTNDPLLRKQIRFLATNFLNKIAPLPYELMALTNKNFRGHYQVGPSKFFNYHRMALAKQMNWFKPFNKNLALGNASPLVLTDSSDFHKLFPLKFLPLQVQDTTIDLSNALTLHLKAHFNQFRQSSEGLTKSLDKSILFDLTALLEPFITTNRQKDKEHKFNGILESATNKISDILTLATKNLIDQYPSLKNKQKEIKRFIKQNITCISNVKIDELHGFKILPVFSKLTDNKLDQLPILNFIVSTGLFIGAINLCRHLRDDFTNHQHLDYIPKGLSNTLYFVNKDDFFQTSLFKRISEKFSSEELKRNTPHIKILGQGTINLLQGLFNEITNDKWEQFNNDPVRREIIQFSLFKIQECLANAELRSADFKNFSANIEFIHCEIATLLEIFSPFQPKDFSQIFLQNLDIIPKSLKKFTTAGLGKTAMTTFAGINKAILDSKSSNVKTFCTNLYYENIDFLGENNSLEKVLADPTSKEIGLYACQFSPNIQLESNHQHYIANDIVADIKKILQTKPNTKHLNVAVDCTIDYNNSSKVRNILKLFEEEILAGRLNFIFYRSGQKFDMMGMDNYYGSPFYVVNNGAKYWNSFKSLTTDEVYRTDNLSNQWFCLANRYTSGLMDEYRNLIFSNNRFVLDNLQTVNPQKSKTMRISTADPNMDSSFIDVKVFGKNHFIKGWYLISLLYQKCLKQGIKIFTRSSFGFFHLNCTLINANSNKESSSIRINLGLNPSENTFLIKFLNNFIKNGN